jgi:hypothetical protein
MNQSNAAIEAAAQDYRDQQLSTFLNDHVDAVVAVEPTVGEFIKEFTYNGSFTTPCGEVDTGHFMEMLDFSTLSPAHDAIQMEALKGDPTTTIIEAAQNWLKLVKLMNAFAVEYQKEHIAPDYE